MRTVVFRRAADEGLPRSAREHEPTGLAAGILVDIYRRSPDASAFGSGKFSSAAHLISAVALVFSSVVLSTVAYGQPVAYWHFDDGKPAQTVTTLVSEFNVDGTKARAGVFGKGGLPVFDSNTPAIEVWDGGLFQIANPDNRASLRFINEGGPGGGAPVGGDVTASGADPEFWTASLTVEAFVKMRRQMPRHALIASKRRHGQSDATWSLSIDPAGSVRARFDTQSDDDPKDRKGFNQSMGSTASLTDGIWHHVALTFDHDTRSANIYMDYERCGGGVTTGPLVFDDSVFVFGRGLDGWLDEVRLTGEVLHPEQFLRKTHYFSELKKQKPYPTFLDQTHTRVQSALKPDLARIGTLIPKSVDQIETSMWSLGCETLDRDLANWNAYKGYLQPLGIKRIRLQGGWNRTEKKKGEYDFAWLDEIVGDAIARGLEVCLETSYNNRLYEPRGATGPGGQLPDGEGTLAAWDKWVEAMVRRYSPKGVKDWMMYNEPNLNKANSPEQIVANNIRTAEIIKRVDPEARIGAFVLAGLHVKMLEDLLTKTNAEGKTDLFHWAIYHGYSGNPDRLNTSTDALNAMLARVAPHIHPWQGEAGCASEEVQYALSGIDWTEYSHAKWNARRMLCDIGHNIESSVFTISDVAYHKDFISRYGLLKTNPDNAIIKVKTAYYTVQNIVSVFNDALAPVPEYDLRIAGADKELTWFAFRDKQSGLDVVTLWDGTEVPSNASDLDLVDMTIKGGHFTAPVWIDMITGNVYEIPEEQVIREADTILLKDVPVYDGPGVVTDTSLLTLEQAREKKKNVARPKKEAKKGTPAAEPPWKAFLLPGTQQPAPAVLILGPADAAALEMAQWLNEQEVHAFVMDTNMSARPQEVLQQARAAIDHMRNRAGEWQVKTDAVGVMARGAQMAATAFAVGANTDFTVLITGHDLGSLDGFAGPKPVALFLGNKDAWKEPLSAWLEKHKGKVF